MRIPIFHRALLLPAAIALAVAIALWLLLPPVPRATFSSVEAGSAHCIRLTFSPDSRCLATMHWPVHDSRDPRVLAVWDVATGTAQATLHRGNRQLESLVFSPTDHTAAGRWHDGGIQVWNRDDGREIAEHRHQAWKDFNPHLQIVYTPEGRLLAYGPWPESGRRWDVITGEEAPRVFQEGAWSMVVGGYEGFIVRFDKDRVEAWHIATGELRGDFTVPEDKVHGSFFGLTADGRLLAAYVNGELKVWRTREAGVHDLPAGKNSSWPVFTPDGSAIAVTVVEPPEAGNLILDWLRTTFKLRDPTQPRSQELRILEVATGRVFARVADVELARFAPDGATLAVAAPDGVVSLYDWPPPTPWGRIVGGAALAAVAAVASLHGLIWAWRRRRAS
jgi:WD40 repeat protein